MWIGPSADHPLEGVIFQGYHLEEFGGHLMTISKGKAINRRMKKLTICNRELIILVHTHTYSRFQLSIKYQHVKFFFGDKSNKPVIHLMKNFRKMFTRHIMLLSLSLFALLKYILYYFFLFMIIFYVLNLFNFPKYIYNCMHTLYVGKLWYKNKKLL